MMLQHPDSLRSVLDSVFAAPAYRWVERRDPLAGVIHAWLAIKEWFNNLQDTQPVLYHIVTYLLVAGVLALICHAAWRFLTEIRATDELDAPIGSSTGRRDEEWYRREADRLAHAGRFAEAVQADFLALVLALDARKALRFHPSKTPGEYARESEFTPGARAEFRELVRRLYAYAFARTPCGPIEFADWRERAAPERYAPSH